MVSNISCLFLASSLKATLKTDLGVWDGQFSTLLRGKGGWMSISQKIVSGVPTLITCIVPI